MKTKEQIKKEIEQKQQELDLLQKELESIKDLKEAWKEEYELNGEKHKYHEEWELYHYTSESFELWMNQFDLMTEMQAFAKLRNGDWVADWGDKSQCKKGLCFYGKNFCIEELAVNNRFVYGISFKSWEIAQEALEIFGERIEQFYGK